MRHIIAWEDRIIKLKDEKNEKEKNGRSKKEKKGNGKNILFS